MAKEGQKVKCGDMNSTLSSLLRKNCNKNYKEISKYKEAKLSDINFVDLVDEPELWDLMRLKPPEGK